MLKKKIFTSTPLRHKPQTHSYMAAAKHVGNHHEKSVRDEDALSSFRPLRSASAHSPCQQHVVKPREDAEMYKPFDEAPKCSHHNA